MNRLSVYLALLGLLLASCAAHSRQEVVAPNRCLPGQSCFPSRQELRSFASTLTGALVQPFDDAYVGLVTHHNTRLTRHPSLVVVAETVEDVQKAMHFARKFQLMVTSSFSDRDPSGRSSYDGSLNINLSKLNNIAANDVNTTRSEHGELTADAGATWQDVYAQARAASKDVVAPSNYKASVGESVGDGGIGPLSRVLGLVADNLLEVRMVMADGTLVTVTEHSVLQDFGGDVTERHYDRTLLAAVAAGGAGVYGIPVSFVFKLHPAPPSIVRVRLQYNLFQAGSYVGKPILDKALELLASMPLKWSGYYYISGLASESEANTKGGLVINLMYYGAWGEDADFDWVDDNLRTLAGNALVADKSVNETGVDVFEKEQPTIIDSIGNRYYQFSRLLQGEPASVKEAEALSEALLFAINSPTVDSTYFCQLQLTGGAMQTAASKVDLVNPLVRSSYANYLCHFMYPGLGLDDTFYINHVFDYIKLLAPFGEGMVRYWAQEDLADWRTSLYNKEIYKELIEAKLRYDVDNYLWSPNSVGADFRVKGCNQNSQAEKNLEFLSYGNKLGGYVSDNRFRASATRNEERMKLQARLVHITQMAVGN